MAYRIRYTGGRYIRRKKQKTVIQMMGIVLCGMIVLSVLFGSINVPSIRTKVVEHCRQILIEAGYHGQNLR